MKFFRGLIAGNRMADRIFVVALPKSLSFGAAFQSRITNANAEIRHYAGVLDGGYGGKYIGLGVKDNRAQQLRDELFDYSRVDSDLLSAVVRASEAEKALSRTPTRVPQRYFIRDGASVANRRKEGADLLPYLVARLGQPAYSPEVFLIVGAGGSGKSWLFEGLFTYLEEAFQKHKNKQEPAVRPIPVVPAGLIEAGSRSATDLFEAVAKAEYGSRGGQGLMDHLVRAGRAILMFDGLDEFFADNHDLGHLISERYFAPDSRARIFIVLRDSLLNTSENVRKLLERFKTGRPLACDRLAQKHGKPQTQTSLHTPQAFGAIVALRLSLRAQCRRGQSRRRRQAPDGEQQ